jgi:hypothetical protein
MFQLINEIITQFRKSFKRQKTWQWFVCIVLGFMIRNDHRGVTSTISALRLKPGLYHTLLHFFRSSAYKVSELYQKWIEVVLKHAPLLHISNRLVLLGDHIKISKEGRRMPVIHKHHQDSQNSGKAEYIEGHNFGQISAVITNGETSRSMAIMTELQASGTKSGGESLIVQMVNLAGKAASELNNPAIVVLDAYFCSGTTWEASDKIADETGKRMLEIVTRAKSNTVAYYEPPKLSKPKCGRPQMYGKKVKLFKLFSERSAEFTPKTMALYGKPTKLQYLCVDLLWRPAKRKVRFVLVKIGNTPFALMSSDLTLTAEEIITLYANRFKIETGFDDLKNDMGGFSYHFWTKALPKRKRNQETQTPTDPKSQEKIKKAVQATEVFVCLNVIAVGILTIIAFRHSREIWNRYPGYIKTVRSPIPTVATTKSTLSQDFCAFLPMLKGLTAFRFIPKLQRVVDFLYQIA